MNHRYFIYGGCILAAIITIIGGVWLLPSTSDDADDETLSNDAFLFEESEEEETDMESAPADEEKKTDIFVDVKGEVARPGIYEMEPDRRVDDAIHEAGGLTEEANQNGINFAKRLQDEMVVYVPHEDEEEHEGWEDTIAEGTSDEGEKININAADEADLEQLSGVGPVTAEAIVQYRDENGNFEQVSDIQNVSGIGEKTYQQLEDHLMVN